MLHGDLCWLIPAFCNKTVAGRSAGKKLQHNHYSLQRQMRCKDMNISLMMPLHSHYPWAQPIAIMTATTGGDSDRSMSRATRIETMEYGVMSAIANGNRRLKGTVGGRIDNSGSVPTINKLKAPRHADPRLTNQRRPNRQTRRPTDNRGGEVSFGLVDSGRSPQRFNERTSS